MKRTKVRWEDEAGWIVEAEKGTMPPEISMAVEREMRRTVERSAGDRGREIKGKPLAMLRDARVRKIVVEIEGTSERVSFTEYKSDPSRWMPAPPPVLREKKQKGLT